MNTKKIINIATYYFPVHIMLTLASIRFSLFIYAMVVLNLVILGLWIRVCADLLTRIEKLENDIWTQNDAGKKTFSKG